MSSKDERNKRQRKRRAKWRVKALDEIGFESMAELAKVTGVNQGNLSNISQGRRKPSDEDANKIICAIVERNYQEGWSFLTAALHFQEAFSYLRNHFSAERGQPVIPLSDDDVNKWHQNHLDRLNQLQHRFDEPLTAASYNGPTEESLRRVIRFLKSWETKHDFGCLGKVKQAFASSRRLLIRPAIVKGMQDDNCYELIKAVYTEIRHIAHLCGAFELVREMSEWLIPRAIARGDTPTEFQAKVTQAWLLTSRNTQESLFEAQKIVQYVDQLVDATNFLDTVTTEQMNVVSLYAELRLRLAIRIDQQRIRPLTAAKFESILEKSDMILTRAGGFAPLKPRMKTRYAIPLMYQHGVYLFSSTDKKSADHLETYEKAKKKFERIAQQASYIGWIRIEQAAYSWLATIFEAMGDRENCEETLNKVDVVYLQKRQRICQHIRSRLMSDE